MSNSTAQRLPQLDGLRGAAILFVVWHHYGLHLPGWIDIGPIAPSIFFLLSGFLITQSLLKRPLSSGQLVSYHARRFGRLLPALYIMLIVGWFTGLPEFRTHLGWHVAFLSNVRMVISDDWAGSLSHLWSLAVQEQFYLLWPLVFLLPARFLPIAFAGLVLSAAVFRAVCLQADLSDFFRWFLLPASLDAFGAGALVAWTLKTREGGRLIPRAWLLPAFAVAAGCWIVARNLRLLEGTGHVALAVVDLLETVTITFLLIILLQNLCPPIVRIFSCRPLVAVGKISYGVYVWHMLVVYAFDPLLARAGITLTDHSVLRCGILTAASLAVASLSWIAIEKPFLLWVRKLTAEDGLWTLLRERVAKWTASRRIS